MKTLLCWLISVLCVHVVVGAGTGDLPKPASRTATNLHGWKVLVDDRLLAGESAQLGAEAIRLLGAKLRDIEYVVRGDRLERLKSVTIVVDLSHGGLRAMQYHPSHEWLERHGYSRDLARCVHICDAADFCRSRQVNEQPWVVLHELAHAYHHQVLGFDNAVIREAFAEFKRGGRGEKVLLFDGTMTRHYGLKDEKEFFAEFTEAYFGVNDFYPFVRAELKTAEPEIYALMGRIWGAH